MTYDPNLQIYHYPCPCGDRFEIPIDSLRDGEEIAVCPSCSLMIRVIFDPVSFPPLHNSFYTALIVLIEGFGQGGKEGSSCEGRSQSVNEIGQNSAPQERNVGRRLLVKQYREYCQTFTARIGDYKCASISNTRHVRIMCGSALTIARAGQYDDTAH